MKWMTKEYVREQAAISDEAALLCSIEHYDQMLMASEEEFRDAEDSGLVSLGTNHCAICVRRLHLSLNKDCPMKHCCGGFCFSEWMTLNHRHNTRASWQNIRAAMGEVRRTLWEKYKELYRTAAKEKRVKKGEPKFIPIEINGTKIAVRFKSSESPYPIAIQVKNRGFVSEQDPDLDSGRFNIHTIEDAEKIATALLAAIIFAEN